MAATTTSPLFGPAKPQVSPPITSNKLLRIDLNLLHGSLRCWKPPRFHMHTYIYICDYMCMYIIYIYTIFWYFLYMCVCVCVCACIFFTSILYLLCSQKSWSIKSRWIIQLNQPEGCGGSWLVDPHDSSQLPKLESIESIHFPLRWFNKSLVACKNWELHPSKVHWTTLALDKLE